VGQLIEKSSQAGQPLKDRVVEWNQRLQGHNKE